VRRWHEGDHGDLCGVPYRVVKGVKFRGVNPEENDLVMQWWVNGRWRNLDMKVGAVMADFFYENEELAFPPERNPKWLGGNYYLAYINGAAQSGWKQADKRLREQSDKQRPYRRHLETN
jgi:hypothetical protein